MGDSVITYIVVLLVLFGIAYYFDFVRWFGSIAPTTGKSLNLTYFILSIGCGIAGRFITVHIENPIGIVFFIASGIFFMVAVYGIISKIK